MSRWECTAAGRAVLVVISDVGSDVDANGENLIGARLSSRQPISSSDDVDGEPFSGFAKLSEIVSLFSFLLPSAVDRAEGFKVSVVCVGSLSGRCVVVDVVLFLTVGGSLAMELSLVCKFKCKFNDN